MKMRPEDADLSGACIEHRFDDPVTLAQALAARVAGDIGAAIAARGHALVALSGGTTPRRFLQELGRQELDWAQVTVTLADERWVAPGEPRSNARLLHETLLQGSASRARFVPLYTNTIDPESGLEEIARRIDALALPFDAIVLGLGLDGHCASLFPDGDHFHAALDPAASARVLPMRSAAAGEPRITLTLPALTATRALYLQIEGAKKREVLARALAADGAMAHSPLRAIMYESHVPLHVYSCE